VFNLINIKIYILQHFFDKNLKIYSYFKKYSAGQAGTKKYLPHTGEEAILKFKRTRGKNFIYAFLSQRDNIHRFKDVEADSY
jgi:hypothetical protein